MGWLSNIFGGPKVQPVTVGDHNFESDVLRSELPVLLDVWGSNCAPCKQLEPIVMDIATRYEGRLRVAEMNASSAPRTMGRLGVRGTPTVIYFHKGKIVERIVGFKGSLYHTEFIENELLPLAAGRS
jgi:thioredoxin-like negative regulator of GroEL